MLCYLLHQPLYLIKPSERPVKLWFSAAVKTDFCCFYVMGTTVMFSKNFPKIKTFFLGFKNQLKLYQNSMPMVAVVSILVSRHSIVMLVLKFWRWNWIALDPFTGNFQLMAAIMFLSNAVIGLGSPWCR